MVTQLNPPEENQWHNDLKCGSV